MKVFLLTFPNWSEATKIRASQKFSKINCIFYSHPNLNWLHTHTQTSWTQIIDGMDMCILANFSSISSARLCYLNQVNHCFHHIKLTSVVNFPFHFILNKLQQWIEFGLWFVRSYQYHHFTKTIHSIDTSLNGIHYECKYSFQPQIN